MSPPEFIPKVRLGSAKLIVEAWMPPAPAVKATCEPGAKPKVAPPVILRVFAASTSMKLAFLNRL